MSSGIFRRRELQCHQSESPMNDRASYVARQLNELDVLSAIGAVVNASEGRGVGDFVHCEDIRATWLDAMDRALLERHLVRLLQFFPSLEDARQYVRSDKALDVYTSLIHYTVFALIGPAEELLLRPQRLARALYSAREKTLPLLMSWLFEGEMDCCVLNGVDRKILDEIRSRVLQDREATRTFITERLCALEKQTPTVKGTHIPETFICDRGSVSTVEIEALLNELEELQKLYNPSFSGVDSPMWEDILDPSWRCRVSNENSGMMKYQWLPTDFRVGDDGEVRTLSPLHGSVHPRDFPALYTAIPRFLENLLPLFERVLGSIATPKPPVPHDIGIGSSHASNRTDEPIKPYKLRGRQLQVVVKLSTVRLDKDHPVFSSDLDGQCNRGWQQESDNHEHIVAVGYYVVRSRNITPPRLSFRAFTHCPEDAGLTSQVDSFLAFGERTSAFYDGRYGRQFLQAWGSLALHEGRSIAVPSFLVHRVEPFELCNPSDPEGGELTVSTFYLVDPSEKPIVSTRTVRPDQWQQTQNFVRANVDMLRYCSSIQFFPDEIANTVIGFASSHVSEHQIQLSRHELLTRRRKMQELRFLTPSLRLSEMKLDLNSEGTTQKIGAS
ncbi:hypothetical protein P3T76_006590 [Phytophthora citrophthora]|uniref:DUF4246 domain-containing protein n=1 Tax=Phytophthora citrophthora TaxID=4793 RepID=A0AAD9GQ68_9STRA|nr:hypothetical protein P3T76_006590 [Phytophthora citrophthora]